MSVSGKAHGLFACIVAAAVLAAGMVYARPAPANDKELEQEALVTLDRAARYFATVLANQGTYVWSYSEDLSVRKGEGDAGPGVGWVQPPGTPAVGAALLRAYEATGETGWLEAARAAGNALARGQLLSGGWYYSIDMKQPGRSAWCYRVDGIGPKACRKMEDNKSRNRTLLDDNTTQSALRFLMWLDADTGGKDKAVSDAISYGLKRLAKSQFANGAWPVAIDGWSRDEEPVPGRKASRPASWPREWVKPDKGPYFILNDNAQSETIRVFLEAAQRYDRPDLLDVAVKAGDFLLDAQMPAPQRGWAQIYDAAMQPVWGRKFEPPAVVSRETAGVIAVLAELYGRTGERRFLDAAREGAAWLRSVQLPDGEWARFYELGTNRPLYVDNSERLTYATDHLLSHYSMKSTAGISEALAYVDAAERQPASRPFWISAADGTSGAELEARVRELVNEADAEGRWVEDGWIHSATFVDAAFMIAKYLVNAERKGTP